MNKDRLLKKAESTFIPFGMLVLLLVPGLKTMAQSRFSMSVDAAPVYGLFRSKSIPKEFEPLNMPGFRAGSSLHFRLSPSWSVSSGLWLEWRGKNNVAFNGQRNLNSHSFKVPLQVHYMLFDKRLSPCFSAGLVWDKFKYSVYSNSKPQQSITVFNVATEPQIKYLLGAGARYRFNEHLAGIIQPTFIYGTRSSERSYQLSLQTQLVFQF